MQTDEITQRLSDNYHVLIIIGGAICFISLFLPFWIDFGETATSWEDDIYHFSVPMSNSWFIVIFVLLIFGLFYGYYREYGDQYPYMFLAIGIGLFFLTSCANQYAPVTTLLGNSYGFFFELIGSLSIATGGYFYYLGKNGLASMSDNGE